MRKLVKAWNKLPAGAAVTTDPQEQVVLVDKDRLAHLEREGHFGEPAREIPAEVRTVGPDDSDATRLRTMTGPSRPVKKEP